MKRIIFALLAVLLVPSLYALNAEPSELRIGDFKCVFSGQESYNSGSDVVFDYRCSAKGEEVGSLYINYRKGIFTQEERLEILKDFDTFDKTTEGLYDGPARASIDNGKDLALVKADLYVVKDYKGGVVTMVRVDRDKYVALYGRIGFEMLQREFSRKEQAQKMLNALLKLELPPYPME